MSAAVSSTAGNGMKRSAATMNSDPSTETSSSSSSNNNNNNAEMSGENSPPPPEKKSFIVVESPIKLGTISSSEDLDIKVLRIQNKNLSERLVQRQRLESELREKINKLQNRKVDDDNKLCLIDRFWTQLDEDLRIMLERFDSDVNNSSSSSSSSNGQQENNSKSETSQENQITKCSSQAVRKFLAKLNDWDKDEIEQVLNERVKFTTQTVAKLVSNYDRLIKKKDLYFKEVLVKESDNELSAKVRELNDENSRLTDLVTKCQERIHTTGLDKKELEDKIVKLENEIKELSSKNDENEYELEKLSDKSYKLDRQLADTLIKLNNLQKQSPTSSTINHVDQNGRIIYHNTLNNQNTTSAANASTNNNANSNVKASNLTDKQLSDIEFELEQQRDLATNRMHELEKLNNDYQAAIRQIEKLKADLTMIPEQVIESTNEYKMLQTKYALIINDNMKLKQALDESRQLLELSKLAFQRQAEQMESEELGQQKRLGNELVQLEEQLGQVRKENELLRIEYEQNMAANEQTGPINKEMRSLITTLQTNNKLLKSDNQRCKKRLDEASKEIEAAKKLTAQLQAQIQQYADNKLKTIKEEETIHTSAIKTEPTTTTTTTNNIDSINNDSEQKPDSLTLAENNNNEANEQQSAADSKDILIRELKEKNKKLQENQKDMKSMLDIYKASSLSSASSSKSSPNSLLDSSKQRKTTPTTTASDLDEAREEIKRLKHIIEKLKHSNSTNSTTATTTSASRVIIPSANNSSSSSSPSMNHHHHHHHHHANNSESHTNNHHSGSTPTTNSNSSSNNNSAQENSSSSSSGRKIRSLEEQVKELHKMLANKKQEEAALLNDMEITGQAFEDMQEQNIRLMQQLREKDDANFKLVSERIKLENVQKILKEEKEIYVQQVVTLQEQQEAQMCVCKRLEEQLQILTQSVQLLEKELVHMQHTCEAYKRQAIDNVQLIQDLKLNSSKYLCQLKESQSQVAEKSEQLAGQVFTNKRQQEEIKHLNGKLERQKKYEMASSMDEVLREEIKEYKEQLRCPSCKVKQKDAVLTKCFHVFCFDCLQKRYDTRQRKCPKCNANFGANDFRKLYLS